MTSRSRTFRRPARGRSRQPLPSRAAPSVAADPKPGRWLRLAQSAWWAVAVVGLTLLILSFQGYALAFQGQDPMTAGMEAPSGFRVLSGLASLASALLCLALAALLYRRKRGEPMALFVSFYVIIYGIAMAGPLEYAEAAVPGIKEVTQGILQPVFFAAPTVWLVILFPDGRPVPPWTRWLFPLSFIPLVLLPFVDTKSILALQGPVSQLLWFTWFALLSIALWSQIYRYRKVSSPAEREQTRWVVFGLAIWLLFMIGEGVPYLYLQNLPPGAPLPGWAVSIGSLWFLSLSIVPVTLTIAILRHRLYDIDVIINRALVYGALTAILAGLYAASISLFQRLFQALTGQKSDAAVVLTTLVLASAFTPVRTRLQTTVDQRFKDVHDARRRLEALAEEVRKGLWVLSPEPASRRLLDEAIAAFDAQGGAVFVRRRGRDYLAFSSGTWDGQPSLAVPLSSGHQIHGRLALSRRTHAVGYTPDDAELLARTAATVASAFPRATKRGRTAKP